MPKSWQIGIGMGWWTGDELEILPATITCEPVILNSDEVKASLRAARDSLKQAHEDNGGSAIATFQIAILADGTVRYAQLVAPTGVPKVDLILTAAVKQLHFSPALMGATPVKIIRSQRIGMNGPA
jgi:hypothetical protein